MNDWKSVLKADPIPWLLEPENPSVRYFTLTDLLECPKDDPQVVIAKRAIPTSRVVAKIFARQNPAGFWESPERPYTPKYKATYWQIMLLSQLGLDREDERGRRACEHIFRFQLEEAVSLSLERSRSLWRRPASRWPRNTAFGSSAPTGLGLPIWRGVWPSPSCP